MPDGRRSKIRPGQERYLARLEDTPLHDVGALDTTAPPESQWKEAWKQLRKNPLFWVSAVLLVFLAVVIAVPGLFTSNDPSFCQPGKSLAVSSPGHPLGFDRQGCDVYSRVIYGARASVAVGVFTTLIVALLGLVTGAVAGFYGGIFDTLISRVGDIFYAIPLLLAAIVLLSALNNVWPDRGFWGSARDRHGDGLARCVHRGRGDAVVPRPRAADQHRVLGQRHRGLPEPGAGRAAAGHHVLAGRSAGAHRVQLHPPRRRRARRPRPEGQEAMSRDLNPDQPLLEVKDLHVGFAADKKTVVPAVIGANLSVYPGQTVAIVGESGSGKSTTAHAIIDLLPGTGRITGGQILFEGQDIAHAKKSDIVALRGSSIGLVPQDPMSNLNPLWRVGTQIKESLEANGVAKGKAADARVVELLEEAGLPDAARRAQQYPHEFSGGMRQRALIAMGLAARPKLLIADEPTSALDVTVQKQILDHLDRLTDELGFAVLLITHDLGLAAERADHLVVMYRGQVVESGPALEILQDPQHPYSKRLVSSAPSLASQRLSSVEARAEVREQAVQTAAEIAAEVATHDDELGEGRGTIIEAKDLTKVFKVLGLLDATSGSVEFDGVDITTLRKKDQQLALRRQMQPVFQNPYASLDPMYSIYRSIEEPLRLHGVGTAKEREAKIRDLLDKVSLPASVMTRYPNELSGGQRQRVAIARALALDPEVVICDEAVSALDVLVQAQILTLLNELQSELGLSYLFITHDLAVVRQIADNVLVMQNGKVVEQSTVSEVFENPREDYTRMLLDAISS